MIIRKNGKLVKVNPRNREEVKKVINELMRSDIKSPSIGKLLKILRYENKFEPYIGDETRKRTLEPRRRPRTPYSRLSRRRKQSQTKQTQA